MGLQAWYPLINDMHNQGVGDTDLVVETTPTFGAGKIGNALISGGNSHWTAAQSEKVLNNNAISICFWVYIDAPEGDTNKRAMFFGNNQKRIYSLFNYPTCNDFHWSWYSYDASGEGENKMGGVLKGVLPSYHWTHVAITYSNPNGAIYINGEEEKTFSGVMDNYTFSDQTPVIYQCAYRKLNDFRIYDHALSPREVKQVSTALVLHYPLAVPGQENLIEKSSDFTGWSINSIFTINQFSTGEYIASASRTGATTNIWSRIIPTVKLNPELYPNGVTVSFDFKCDDISALDHKCICSLQIYNSSNTRIGWYESKNTFTEVNYVGSTTLKDGVWKRLSCYFTQSNLKTVSSSSYTVSDVSYTMLSFQLVKNGSISFKSIKLEEGSIATPWIPNPADAEYTALGFNDGIEYDVSGYQYNGTRNNVTPDGDTVRYSGCYVFNGTNSWIKCDTNEWMVQGATEFTINWWAYAEDWTAVTTGGRMVSCTESGGFNVEGGASGYLRFPHHVYTNAEKTSLAYQYNNNGIKLSDLTSGWHMFTLVYDLTGEKIYIDGALHSEEAKASYGIHFNTSARLFLGCEANAAQPYAPYFNGKMSDFRFYYTALSADDILELYHTPETLSHNGTLLTQGEFVES